jgi:hypothetical protein
LSSREFQIDLGDALMEVNTGTPAKRSRAKVKSESAATEEKKPAVAVKKARAPKKVNVATTITVTRAPMAQETAVRVQPNAEEIKAMIATAAYYLAAERHFSPGHELDDWLAAERRIQALFE